jgi:5-methylcytosine-specific restriction endonuclease McrA
MSTRKSQEWRDKISHAKKGKVPYIPSQATKDKCRIKKIGEQNPNWRGGITTEYKRIRESARYREWRKMVFSRDGYKCVWCGDKNGGNLEADHIKPRKTHPELVFEVENGRTLCRTCHRKTETWGNLKKQTSTAPTTV